MCLYLLGLVELEAMEQQKKAKVEAAAAAAAAATPTTAPQPSTPDYAAGLMAPATPVSDNVTFTLLCQVFCWGSGIEGTGRTCF